MKYYSVTAAARLVSVSRTTMSGWVNRGAVKAARVSKTLVRISEDDLRKFLEGNFGAA